MKILNTLQHLGGCAPQTPCLMLYRTPLADILRTPLLRGTTNLGVLYSDQPKYSPPH